MKGLTTEEVFEVKTFREALYAARELRAAAQTAAKRKRPSKAQCAVLETMAVGGHIEQRELSDAVLVSKDGSRRVIQDSVYWALQDRGWLWMLSEGTWLITTRGRSALASAEGGRR